MMSLCSRWSTGDHDSEWTTPHDPAISRSSGLSDHLLSNDLLTANFTELAWTYSNFIEFARTQVSQRDRMRRNFKNGMQLYKYCVANPSLTVVHLECLFFLIHNVLKTFRRARLIRPARFYGMNSIASRMHILASDPSRQNRQSSDPTYGLAI